MSNSITCQQLLGRGRDRGDIGGASEDAFFASEEPSWALRAATIIASEVSAMRFLIEPSRLVVPANSEASSSALARIAASRTRLLCRTASRSMPRPRAMAPISSSRAASTISIDVSPRRARPFGAQAAGSAVPDCGAGAAWRPAGSGGSRARCRRGSVRRADPRAGLPSPRGAPSRRRWLRWRRSARFRRRRSRRTRRSIPARRTPP